MSFCATFCPMLISAKQRIYNESTVEDNARGLFSRRSRDTFPTRSKSSQGPWLARIFRSVVERSVPAHAATFAVRLAPLSAVDFQ